jgi:hypothetical protein
VAALLPQLLFLPCLRTLVMVDEGWACISRVHERLLWQQQAQLLMGALQHTEAAAFYKTLLISGAAVECAPMVAEGTCMSNLLVKGVMASGNLRTHHEGAGGNLRGCDHQSEAKIPVEKVSRRPSCAVGKSVIGSSMSNFLEKEVMASGNLCTHQEGAGGNCDHQEVSGGSSVAFGKPVIGSCMSSLLAKEVVASGNLCAPKESTGENLQEPALPSKEWQFPRKAVKPSFGIDLVPSRRQRSRWEALLMDESGPDEEVPGIRKCVSVPSLFGARDSFFEAAAENLPSVSKKKAGLAPLAPKPSDDDLLDAAIAEVGASLEVAAQGGQTAVPSKVEQAPIEQGAPSLARTSMSGQLGAAYQPQVEAGDFYSSLKAEILADTLTERDKEERRDAGQALAPELEACSSHAGSVIGSCMSNFLEKGVMASGDLCAHQEGAGGRGEDLQTTLGNQADSVSGSGGTFDLQISCNQPPALENENPAERRSGETAGDRRAELARDLPEARQGSEKPADFQLLGKAALVEKVKALQRGDQSVNEAWWAYCDYLANGTKDPGRHDADSLNLFLSMCEMGVRIG